MDKILSVLRRWIVSLLERDCVRDDPFAHMSTHELADLPSIHPERDECPC